MFSMEPFVSEKKNNIHHSKIMHGARQLPGSLLEGSVYTHWPKNANFGAGTVYSWLLMKIGRWKEVGLNEQEYIWEDTLDVYRIWDKLKNIGSLLIQWCCFCVDTQHLYYRPIIILSPTLIRNCQGILRWIFRSSLHLDKLPRITTVTLSIVHNCST